MQTALPAILALTLPAERTAIGSVAGGLPGVLDPINRINVLTPLAIIFLTSAANCFYLGPVTTKTMRERKHQETRDGKQSYDPGPHSKEMERLNRRFGVLHGMSASLNVVGGLATMWYGFYLGGRLL